ncbi:MAG: PAS domain S-box protein [Planctomycetota bacterium]
MTGQHSLLARQLRKSEIDDAAAPPRWRDLLAAVSQAYHDFDTDRKMVEHSLELSSMELHSANAEMRAIFQAMPDMFFVIDSAGLVLDCRGGRTTDIKHAPSQAVGRCLYDLPVSGNGKLFRAAVAKVMNEQKLISFTYPVRDGGAKRFYEARLTPLSAGQCIAIVRDVTEAKEALLALRDQRALFETVLRQAADGIVVSDAAGRVVFVNHAASTIAMKDPLASNLGDVAAVWGEPHDARGLPIPAAQWATARALRGETCPTQEVALVRGPGGHLDVLVGASPIHDLARQLTGVVTTFTDITPLKTAQDDLRASEERFRQVADNFPQVIWLIDLKHDNATYVSPAYERVWGQTLASIAQDPDSWKRLVDPADRDRLEALLLRAAEIPFEVEYRIVRANGMVRWIHSRGFPIRDAHGQVLRVCRIAEDITDRKTLQTQLMQAQKLESIGQLAAGIAHEINTPTQYVGDNTAFLRDAFGALSKLIESYRTLLAAARTQSVSETLIQAIDQAEQEADFAYLTGEIPRAIDQSLEGLDRVSKIVRAMKEFSHPGSVEKQPVDINRAIESTLTVCHNEWKYVAQVETDLDRSLPPVPALAGELNQVLLNIIVNAAHAIQDAIAGEPDRKGTITVQTRAVAEYAEIRIGDTGTGIDERIRHKIFDPFFTTKPVGKGTGQGLAIARSVVVDKHGGELTCESQVGVGSTFVIRLPLKKDGAAAPAEAGT